MWGRGTVEGKAGKGLGLRKGGAGSPGGHVPSATRAPMTGLPTHTCRAGLDRRPSQALSSACLLPGAAPARRYTWGCTAVAPALRELTVWPSRCQAEGAVGSQLPAAQSVFLPVGRAAVGGLCSGLQQPWLPRVRAHEPVCCAHVCGTQCAGSCHRHSVPTWVTAVAPISGALSQDGQSCTPSPGLLVPKSIPHGVAHPQRRGGGLVCYQGFWASGRKNSE